MAPVLDLITRRIPEENIWGLDIIREKSEKKGGPLRVLWGRSGPRQVCAQLAS